MFVVQRQDTHLYTFSKASFHHLQIDDFEYMYNMFRDMMISKDNITYALEAIKRFLRRHINFSYCYDFQLGIETNQRKINLIKPNLKLPDLENYPLFTILQDPEFGIVYKNGQNVKWFLIFSEVAKTLHKLIPKARIVGAF
ncbi:hypothetical protein L6452_37185 [Arctium lappa]|uniref:Uncharacterized protein n=1 Tax=Arctium lappa TaxID=4217 RepID=A0ACB8Y2Y5_ARCLA|nr:hypothetical protein L6452_37185 [Arctium lappa]